MSKILIGVVCSVVASLIGFNAGQLTALNRQDVEEVVVKTMEPAVQQIGSLSRRIDSHDRQISDVRTTAQSARERVDMMQRWWQPKGGAK